MGFLPFFLYFVLPIQASHLEDWGQKICSGHFSKKIEQQIKNASSEEEAYQLQMKLDQTLEQESQVCDVNQNCAQIAGEYIKALRNFEVAFLAGVPTIPKKVTTSYGRLYPLSYAAKLLEVSAGELG